MYFRYLVLSVLFTGFLCTCDRAQEDDQQPITLTRESISITVDPNLGGRITSLTYGGREILQTVSDSGGYNTGSTAWTSPQKDWGWPPPATFDSDTFTVQRVKDHEILMISQPDSSGLKMQKRVRLGLDSDVGLTYWLTYEGEGTRSVAAWENTRLPYDGYLTFVSDSVRLRDVTSIDTAGTRVRVTFDERQTQPAKLFASLVDTIAPAYHHDGIVLRKETAVHELYRTAPEQAPLEVYWNPERGFVEFELQGDYRELRYGETATLRTRWVVGRE